MCSHVSCIFFVFLCQWCAAYLEAASFGGVQDEELLEQVLTVGGHVKGNPVFTTQHTLPQFLKQNKKRVNICIYGHIHISRLFFSYNFRFWQNKKTKWWPWLFDQLPNTVHIHIHMNKKKKRNQSHLYSVSWSVSGSIWYGLNWPSYSISSGYSPSRLIVLFNKNHVYLNKSCD